MMIKIRAQILASFSAIVLLLVIGTTAYHFMEKWTWIQSFYFSVVTLGTVGYGDLVPSTDLARLFTALYIIVGAAIFMASLGVIGASYLRKREMRIIRRRNRKNNKKISS